MTKEKKTKWGKIGEGEHNIVYKKSDIVLKIPKYHDKETAPKRLARYWNRSNPDLTATALMGPSISWNIDQSPTKVKLRRNSIFMYVEDSQLKAKINTRFCADEDKNLTYLPEAGAIMELIENDGASFSSLEQEYQVRKALAVPHRGIVVPYVEGHTDIPEEDIAKTLVDIYARTRQIILDYDGEGNLIYEPSTGKIRCIDFDEAVRCDSPRIRKYSSAKDPHEYFRRYYIDNKKDIQMGTYINLSLFYMEKYLSDYLLPLKTLNKYITFEVISALKEFEEKSIPLDRKTLEILLHLTQIYPENKLYLSADCIHALEVNIDTHQDIEKICNELHEKLRSEPEEQYMQFIEKEHFISYLKTFGEPVVSMKM